MPRFNLISPLDPSASCELHGLNATAALDIAIRREMGSAHVFEDGKYLFSASHSRAGLWVISKDASQGVALDRGGKRSLHDAREERLSRADVATPQDDTQ